MKLMEVRADVALDTSGHSFGAAFTGSCHWDADVLLLAVVIHSSSLHVLGARPWCTPFLPGNGEGWVEAGSIPSSLPWQ